MPRLTLTHVCRVIGLVTLLTSPLGVAAETNLICTVTADQFPGFENGLLESRTVTLTGRQGEAGGQAAIYENAEFNLRVIAGRTSIREGETTLMDFYVEAQNLDAGHSIRAASASFSGGPHQARLELVTYPAEAGWYEGIVIFECNHIEKVSD